MHERLRALREEKNLTQKQVADGVGVASASTISMWEAGLRKPPVDTIPKLAQVLGCDISDLFAVSTLDTDAS